MKATPKKGVAVFQKKHPAGLWIDPEAFQRINGRATRPDQKERLELYPRYLELAELVLGPVQKQQGKPGHQQNWKRTNKGKAA